MEWAELEMKNAYLTAEVEEAQAALARKYQEVQEVLKRAQEAEVEVAGLRAEAQAATQRAAKADQEALALRAELLLAHTALEASNAARQQMETCALSIAADLTANASHVASDWSAVQQQQLVNLDAQRSAEEQLLSILRKQRVSLQAEVNGVKAELDFTKSKLSKVEVELATLAAAQTAKRKQALEAIITLASRELAEVGDGVDHGVASLKGQLAGIQAGTTTIADSLEAVSDIAAEANSRSTEKACGNAQQAIKALGDVAQRAASLSESAERSMFDAAKKLKSLEQLGGDQILEDVAGEADEA